MDLAVVSRLLALNIGWYQEKYGDVPQEDPSPRHNSENQRCLYATQDSKHIYVIRNMLKR
jgi:hypothetical protein